MIFWCCVPFFYILYSLSLNLCLCFYLPLFLFSWNYGVWILYFVINLFRLNCSGWDKQTFWTHSCPKKHTHRRTHKKLHTLDVDSQILGQYFFFADFGSIFFFADFCPIFCSRFFDQYFFRGFLFLFIFSDKIF